VLDHGVSDGAAYELLEYIPAARSRASCARARCRRRRSRTIVREIARRARAASTRTASCIAISSPRTCCCARTAPLRLALTDFGIASLSTATQHFTCRRAPREYAAPEVLTGVLDEKSDWWSLGMIALEAASGRHPFDGLTEQVMNHQLATRPIDVRGVYDDDSRKLCAASFCATPTADGRGRDRALARRRSVPCRR
jgi:serine/threonine protein kinase